MKKTIYFLLSLFLLAFSTCKTEKECPGFNSEDLTEFTYLNADTIYFKNETDSLFQIFISNINMSAPFTYDCKDLHKVCPCINYVEAQATDTKTNTSYIFLRMEQSDVSEMQYFKYNVQGFQFEFDFINELPHIDQMNHIEYFSSFLIGNITYTDVILITNHDTESADIFQVYFNKQKGVLRFIEKSTNMIWSLNNDQI